jgi:hypothetical protein
MEGGVWFRLLYQGTQSHPSLTTKYFEEYVPQSPVRVHRIAVVAGYRLIYHNRWDPQEPPSVQDVSTNPVLLRLIPQVLLGTEISLLNIQCCLQLPK